MPSGSAVSVVKRVDALEKIVRCQRTKRMSPMNVLKLISFSRKYSSKLYVFKKSIILKSNLSFNII